MYVKIHETEQSIVTAICDDDLLGKKFSEKEFQLNVSKEFYDGDKISNEEDIIKIMEASVNLNLVGKKTIEIATKIGLVDKKSVIEIKGIPHAQVVEVKKI